MHIAALNGHDIIDGKQKKWFENELFLPFIHEAFLNSIASLNRALIRVSVCHELTFKMFDSCAYNTRRIQVNNYRYR